MWKSRNFSQFISSCVFIGSSKNSESSWGSGSSQSPWSSQRPWSSQSPGSSWRPRSSQGPGSSQGLGSSQGSGSSQGPGSRFSGMLFARIFIKEARFKCDKKQPFILGAAVQRCSGSILSGRELYFIDVFEDFGHIFPICSKAFTQNLKVGKIFRCVTSFYQHFFVGDKISYYKTKSGNSYK